MSDKICLMNTYRIVTVAESVTCTIVVLEILTVEKTITTTNYVGRFHVLEYVK